MMNINASHKKKKNISKCASSGPMPENFILLRTFHHSWCNRKDNQIIPKLP